MSTVNLLTRSASVLVQREQLDHREDTRVEIRMPQEVTVVRKQSVKEDSSKSEQQSNKQSISLKDKRMRL